MTLWDVQATKCSLISRPATKDVVAFILFPSWFRVQVIYVLQFFISLVALCLIPSPRRGCIENGEMVWYGEKILDPVSII